LLPREGFHQKLSFKKVTNKRVKEPNKKKLEKDRKRGYNRKLLISLDKIQEVIIQEHKRRLNSLAFFHDRK
jgi:hypothetical protein